MRRVIRNCPVALIAWWVHVHVLIFWLLHDGRTTTSRDNNSIFCSMLLLKRSRPFISQSLNIEWWQFKALLLFVSYHPAWWWLSVISKDMLSASSPYIPYIGVPCGGVENEGSSECFCFHQFFGVDLWQDCSINHFSTWDNFSLDGTKQSGSTSSCFSISS